MVNTSIVIDRINMLKYKKKKWSTAKWNETYDFIADFSQCIMGPVHDETFRNRLELLILTIGNVIQV